MGSWIWVKIVTLSFGKKKFEKHQLNFVEQTTSKQTTEKKKPLKVKVWTTVLSCLTNERRKNSTMS